MRAGAMAKNGSTIPSLAREPPSPSDRTQEVAGSSPASSTLARALLDAYRASPTVDLNPGSRPPGRASSSDVLTTR